MVWLDTVFMGVPWTPVEVVSGLGRGVQGLTETCVLQHSGVL